MMDAAEGDRVKKKQKSRRAGGVTWEAPSTPGLSNLAYLNLLSLSPSLPPSPLPSLSAFFLSCFCCPVGHCCGLCFWLVTAQCPSLPLCPPSH
jgi:uncharacterized membrane protein